MLQREPLYMDLLSVLLLGLLLNGQKTLLRKSEPKTVHLLIKINPNLKKTLNKLAREEEKTTQRMIEEILESYVKNSTGNSG